MSLLFHQQYIAPWQSRVWRWLFVAVFCGLTANQFLRTFITFDMAAASYGALLAFLGGWYFTSGAILFPVFYLCLKHQKQRWLFALIIALQCVGLILVVLWPAASSAQTGWHQAAYTGVIMAIIVTGYWQLYHLNIARHAQAQHIAQHMTLVKMLGLLGNVVAGLVIGVLAGWQQSGGLVLLAFVLQTLATCLLINITGPAQAAAPTDTVWQHMARSRLQTFGIVLSILCFQLFEILLPAWLLGFGVQKTSVGLLVAVQAGLALLCAPFISHFAHFKPRQTMIAACVCVAISMGLLLWYHAHWWGLGGGALAGAFGTLLAGVVIEKTWYGTPSAAGVMARETTMSLTRIVTLPPMLWLAMFAPMAYAICGLILGVALIIFGHQLQKQQQKA